MKKFLKVTALLAVLAVCGTMALAGCENNSSDSGSDSNTSTSAGSSGNADAMTEADVATVSASMQTMADYSGSFTVKEQSVLDYKVSGVSAYDSTMTVTAFLTYDDESKKAGLGTSIDGTNLYADYDFDMGYYTIPTESGYMQYMKYAGGGYSSYTGTQYASVADLDFYYTDFAGCMQDEFGIDLEGGAAAASAEEMAMFWQDMLEDNIDSTASVYGMTFNFTPGECTTKTVDGVTIYSFGAQASATATVSGYDYTDDIVYTVNVQLDGAKISKIQTDIVQAISTVQDGITLHMTAASAVTDEFIYAYDASLIPEDFSGYTVEGTVVS